MKKQTTYSADIERNPKTNSIEFCAYSHKQALQIAENWNNEKWFIVGLYKLVNGKWIELI